MGKNMKINSTAGLPCFFNNNEILHGFRFNDVIKNRSQISKLSVCMAWHIVQL